MSEWISVEDRFPDFEQDMLCFVDGCLKGVFVGRFDKEFGFHNPSTSMFSSNILQHVTHWQKLPPPPTK